MRIVYRAEGRGGGQWDIHSFVKSNSYINYNQWNYANLSDVGQAIDDNRNKFAGRVDRLVSHGEDIRLTTNLEEEYVLPLAEELGDLSDRNVIVRTNYNPCRNDKSIDLWVFSRYMCESGLYNLEPKRSPEPPYTIYTDASYWPELERASVGFVVTGSNNGVYSFGSPISKRIPDNNVAEFYCALSALKKVPRYNRVEIRTDSENLKRINEVDVENPRSDVISSLSKEISNFKSINIETVDRSRVEISDEIARMCKVKPMEFGSEPKSTF